MELEYSKNPRLRHVIGFSKSEVEILCHMAKKEIKVFQRKADAVVNNPKNEGQVRYERQIDEHLGSIKFLEELIEVLQSQNS